MAPSIPEEIDVFTRPHSRMKELVNNFTKKMLQADLSHAATLTALVSELHATLLEFRRHEAIENVLILDRLRQRIRQRRKRAPPHLGTCHDDDALPRLFEFVRWCEGVLGSRGHCGGVEGSSCADVGDRLHSAYTHFLKHFLPHMKQEEQEFQPLLMTHFAYNELKALKNEVWQQHQLYTEQQLPPRDERTIPPTPPRWTGSSSSLRPVATEPAHTAAIKPQRSPDMSNDKGRNVPPPAPFPRSFLRVSPPAESVPPPIAVRIPSTRTANESSSINEEHYWSPRTTRTDSPSLDPSWLSGSARTRGDGSSPGIVEGLMSTDREYANTAKTSSPAPVPGPYASIRKSNVTKSQSPLLKGSPENISRNTTSPRLASGRDSIHQDTNSSRFVSGVAVVPRRRRRRPYQFFSNPSRGVSSSGSTSADEFCDEFIESLLTWKPSDAGLPNGETLSSAHQSSSSSSEDSDGRDIDEFLAAAAAIIPRSHETSKPDVAEVNTDISSTESNSSQDASPRGYESNRFAPSPPGVDTATDKVFLTKSSKDLFNRQRLPYNNDLNRVATASRQSSIDDECSTNAPNTMSFAPENCNPEKENVPVLEHLSSSAHYSSTASSASSSTDSLNLCWYQAPTTSNTSTSKPSQNVSGVANLTIAGPLSGVKLDTTACLAGSTGLAVTRPTASLLVLSNEVLLQILRFLSPRDLVRLAGVSQALNVVAFDKSLWRHLMPTQWARGLWTWQDLRLGDALEDQRCLDADDRFSSSVDEDADEDTASSSPSSRYGARKHRAVLRGLASVVCRRTGHAVHTVVLDGAGVTVCSRALNTLLARCPNLVTLSAAYCSLDYFTFKGLWQKGALRKLQTLDLRGCEKLDDTALNCLAMCADRPFKRRHVPESQQPSNSLRYDHSARYSTTSSGSNSSSTEDINSGSSSNGDGSYGIPIKGLGDETPPLSSCTEDEQDGVVPLERNYNSWLGAGKEATDVRDVTEKLQQLTVHDEDRISNEQVGSDDDGYGSVQRGRIDDGLVRWNYHPTQFDTVRVSSYLSTVIQTNFSATKPSTIQQSWSLRSSSNESSERSTPDPRVTKHTKIVRQSSLRYLNLSGCKSITGIGLDILSESGFLDSLQEVDLSGCDRLTSDTLNSLVHHCPRLTWPSVAYCDNVLGTDGDQEASGCNNLANPLRHCCRSGE